MSESKERKPEQVEEIVIDLTNVPLKPIGKSEIQQLEMALIVGTLYRPEILELLRDPTERSTWIDSLAVAAAAFARYKAGLPVSVIAEELGRTEATIRNHITGKTKAGKLVIETYEKMVKGELKLVAPFIKAPVAPPTEEIKILRQEVEKLKEERKNLEERVKNLEKELEAKSRELETLRSEVKAKGEELEKLKTKLEEIKTQIKGIEEHAQKIMEIAKSIAES
jgi:hypothetical protein